ncbi:MAG: hypothetical protein A3J83_06900 [Elusimicrobia bacterium RIFOXYA2_FULL_40_6]|nr:MAG: hypothetical protein A3J83_06900 [Elusimicrobia bacterium RIFOXYA2_FULL_40_6]
MFRTKKLSVLVVLFVVAVFFMVGCSKAKTGSRKVVLRYENAESTVTQIKIMKQICDEFMKENPDIEIKLTYATTQEKIITEMAGDVCPDVFFWWNGVTDLINRDALLPLNDYVKKYKIDKNQYFKGLVDYYTYKDELYSMPLQLNTWCLAYNKTMFDKEKLPYPTDKWTWKDYYESSKKFCKDTNGDGIRDQFGSSAGNTEMWIYMNGGKIVDFDKKKCVIDSKSSREALEYLVKFRKDCAPTRAEASSFSDLKMGISPFLSGKMAMQVTPAWQVSAFAAKKDLVWDVVPLPIPPNGKRIVVFGEGGMCISKKTKYPDEAFRFVAFYCGKRGMELFGEGKNGIPALKSAAKTVFITPPPDSMKYYVEAAESATVPIAPKVESYTKYFQPYEKYNELLFIGNINVDECVKAIVKDTDALLKGAK